MSEITEHHQEHLLVGWAETTVGDVAHTVRGVTYKKDQSSIEHRSGLVPLVRANNIQSSLEMDGLVYVPSKFVSEEQRLLPGDIVLAMSSGSKDLVGKAAQCRTPVDATFGAFCGVVRPSCHIHPYFLG